jgi:hypothetical protein
LEIGESSPNPRIKLESKHVDGKLEYLNNQEKKLLQDIKHKGMEDTEGEDEDEDVTNDEGLETSIPTPI